MTTEIKVILESEPLTDIGVLTSDERDLLFEQLGESMPTLGYNTLDSFATMAQIMINEKTMNYEPTIKELLLRKIILLSQNCGSIYNTIVIPIIPHITRQRTLPVYAPVGGAWSRRGRMYQNAKPTETTRIEIEGSINVRFDSPIFCISKTADRYIEYIVPANEEISVIGLIFNPICKQLVIPDDLGTNYLMTNPTGASRNSNPNGNNIITALQLDLPTISDRLLTGAYSTAMAATACDGYFNKYIQSCIIAGEAVKSSFKVMFENDAKTIELCHSIFVYLTTNNNNIHSRETAYLFFTQLRAAMQRIKTPIVTAKLYNYFAIYSAPPPGLPKVYPPSATDHILTALEKIHYGRFNKTYSYSVLEDLHNLGFDKIYQAAISYGIDAPTTSALITKFTFMRKQKLFQRNLQIKLQVEANKLSIYQGIILKKLGPKRAEQVQKLVLATPAISTAASAILGVLQPQERKIIQLEFDKRELYLEAVMNNKCTHVRLYRQFRLTKEESNLKRIYDELKQFYKNAHQSTEMINCNICSFPIICPHIRDFTEFANKSHAEIRGKLLKYIDKSAVKDQYYCKICGEIISSLEAYDDIAGARDPLSTMNEELKNLMWGEMIVIIRYLKFDGLVNVSHLISVMRDACYPYIFDFENQILKSKTNNAEEIKAKKRLYITIYAFAYIIHIILSNKGAGVDFKNFVPRGKNLIVDLIKHSLDIIISIKNIAIREIPGMTGDVLKNAIIEAYRSLQNIGMQVLTYSGETEDIICTLLLDPIYNYYYSIDLITSGRKLPKPGDKYAHIDRIDEIMGSEIKKTKGKNVESKLLPSIFSSVKDINFGKWNRKPFRGLVRVDLKTLAADYAAAWPGYIADSYELFTAAIKARIYNEAVYIDITSTNRPTDYITSTNRPTDHTSDDTVVKYRGPHEKQFKMYQEYLPFERMLMAIKAQLSIQGYGATPFISSRQWKYINTPLGRIYDENGLPHLWDSIILDGQPASKDASTAVSMVGKNNQPPGDNTQSINIATINKQLVAGIAFTGKVVDRKCSICGILWSKVAGLSESKIREALHINRTISNFFRFYETRCPTGSVHLFQDNKCTQCAMHNTYQQIQDADAVAYYRVHVNTYLAERDKFQALDIMLKPATTIVTATIPSVANENLEKLNKWSFDFNTVLDLANKLKINHRLISAIGAVEKQDYADVQSGVFLPSEADSKYDTRVYTIDTHIKNLITEWNQLRNFHRLVKPTASLSQLVDDSGISKHNIVDLAKYLPDIYDDYNRRFNYIRDHKKPRDIVAFCIQTFCEMCLQIWNHSAPTTEKLRHGFVNYFIRKTLRGEELMSKHGYFNWALLYGDKEPKTSDSNTSRDIDEVEREDEDNSDDDGISSTAAPFSTADLDVEDSDDEDANQIKVGDNYGM